MRILSFGSLNIDHVYQVAHFVRPGETLSCMGYQQFCGGKGFNQSIALAYAGATVSHAGLLGGDGARLRDRLETSGVDTHFVESVDGPNGHAIIQVNPEGENSIIIHGGANRLLTKAYIDTVLGEFTSGDHVLLQNEINKIPEIMEQSAQRGLSIAFNPAPMHPDVLDYPLDRVSCFIINEIEGAELTGESEPDQILSAMKDAYPRAATVLTLGEKGVLFGDGTKTISVPAPVVEPVDTTAAGDTFIGYFLTDFIHRRDIETTLHTACRAAAICVTRPGAADAIPRRDEVDSAC